MPELALSTSWHAARYNEGEPMLQAAADLGFKVVELSHNIRFSLWPGIQRGVEKGIVRVQSLHNFCPVPLDVMRPNPNCYQFTDARPGDYQRAVYHSKATIKAAAELGAEVVVLHLGRAGPEGVSQKLNGLWQAGRYLSRDYTRAKIEAIRRRRTRFAKIWKQVKAALEPLVELAAEKKIRLGIEVRECFEEFPNEEELPVILNELPAEHIGYWHDFGHAARKEFMSFQDHAETLLRLSGRLIGYHLHDCLPPRRDHQAVGKGTIDLQNLLPKVPAEAIPVLELSPRAKPEDLEESLEKWNSYVSVPA